MMSSGHLQATQTPLMGLALLRSAALQSQQMPHTTPLLPRLLL